MNGWWSRSTLIIRDSIPPAEARDAVEGKLFGIGLESFTVGSHELYFGYALSRRLLYTLDMGHYHPTESVADKLSAVLGFLPEVLLHVSRGVRWDSDHVVVLNDELSALAQQLVRGRFLPQDTPGTGLLRRQHQSRGGVGHWLP